MKNPKFENKDSYGPDRNIYRREILQQSDVYQQSRQIYFAPANKFYGESRIPKLYKESLLDPERNRILAQAIDISNINTANVDDIAEIRDDFDGNFMYHGVNNYGDEDGVAHPSSEVIIDIGKYLSIPVMPVFITSEAYTSEPVFVKSCSSAYAGLVTRVTVGDSTTNLILPNVTAQFRLKPGRIQALSDAGYVVLEEKAKGVYKHQLWVEILDTICSADDFGNRPCDWGCPCDRCHSWECNHEFATLLKENGLDYSFYAKYL